jgi:hypothetical protein
MSEADDLVNESAEEAHSSFDRYVAVTMAILAVLLASDSLFSHRAHTEELLNQAQASDQWAFYQAKTIRRAVYDATGQVAGLTTGPSAPKAEAVVKAFEASVARYEKEAEAIQEDAKKFEEESKLFGRRANRYDIGEIFLEISIVLCSMAIMTKRRMLWLGSMAIGAVGVIVALTVLTL